MRIRRILLVILVVMLSTAAAYATTTTTSPYTGNKYTHNSMFDNYEKFNGIDVSVWQGDINWAKVKNSGAVDFAIVRTSFSSISDGSLHTDSKYKANLSGASKYDIPCGVYHFSQAITQKEAKSEANYLLKRIKGYDVTLPVVIDFEFGSNYRINALKKKTKTYNTNVVSAFCKVIKDAGYTPMVYANYSEMTTYLKPSTLLSKGYQLWLAQWSSKASLSQKYICWQYSSKGKVAGISDNVVDCNFFYDNGTYVSKKVTGVKKTSSTADSITLGWNTKQAASSYYIYRSDAYSGSYVKIGESTTNSYTDKNLASGRQYYYRVAAHYDDMAVTGNKSSNLAAYTTNEFSRIGKASAKITMRSNAGTTYKSVRTLAKNSVVSVIADTKDKSGNTWYRIRYMSGSVNKTGYVLPSNLIVYNVRKTSKQCSLYGDSSDSSNVLGTVKAGTAFKVDSAKTVSGVRWYKGNVMIGTKKIAGWIKGTDTQKYGNYKMLGKTTGVKKSATADKSLTLKWNAKSAAQVYRVYRAKAYNGKYKLVATVSANNYTDNGLTKGYTYYYKIRSGNVFEYGKSSSIKIASTTKVKATGIVKTKVKMRRLAGTKYKVKKTLKKGAVVTIDYTTRDKSGNKWYHVKYKKTSGYVSAKYIKKLSSVKINNVPVVDVPEEEIKEEEIVIETPSETEVPEETVVEEPAVIEEEGQ